MNLQQLQRARRAVRNSVTRLVRQIEELVQENPGETDQIGVHEQLLVEAVAKLEELDYKIQDQLVLDEAPDEELDQEVAGSEDWKKRVLMLRKRLASPVENPSPPPSVAPSRYGSCCETRKYKLPKIKITPFSGDLKDWIRFWGQFEKIDTDSSLDGADKFQYLLQSIEPETEAYELVSGYPQSRGNYPVVIAVLKKRYGNEDLLLQVYVRELLKLVVVNVSTSNKMPFNTLYLKLDAHLRALRTLNLERADPATWLFPLVESSLSDDILVAWQRKQANMPCDSSNRLADLMKFLEAEVEIQQKLTLAREGFGTTETSKKKKNGGKDASIPTLAACHTVVSRQCVFCGNGHDKNLCSNARRMPLEKRKEILKEKNLCFSCVNAGHRAKTCRVKMVCMVCFGKHTTVMCPVAPSVGEAHQSSRVEKPLVSGDQTARIKTTKSQNDIVNSGLSNSCSSEVLLQTVCVNLVHNGKMKTIRVFIDNGSQGSYILKSTAQGMNLVPKGEEWVSHSLFGGRRSNVVRHQMYEVELCNLDGTYSCRIPVRDQVVICHAIERISKRSAVWNELQEKNILLTDVGESNPEIELLLGSNVYGRILTGEVIELSVGRAKYS